MLDTCHELHRLGTREVTLIGGEAYLSPHCLHVIKTLTSLGIRVSMQTGGLGFSANRAARFAGAGLKGVGFSIDGPADVHDVLRDRPGSWKAATAGMRNARDAGMVVTANSQINALNYTRLEETAALLKANGARIWRCQLTVPMGRAADRPDWILQPYRVPEVIDELARLQVHYAEQARDESAKPSEIFNILTANNLGYYGPHEVLLRSSPGTAETCWQGCQAGKYTLGIESDGTVKGCPSLPTGPYAGGNLREVPLGTIWETAPELRFARERTVDELWGHCRTCYYADVCRGGCSFTAHCTLGKRGNNPFCYHRATKLAAEGRRERIEHREKAAGDPYDFGRFALVEEDLP
jgi:radical SAM protein with 4Fe4S-binding SPASM domain